MVLNDKSIFSVGFWGIPNFGDELICRVVFEYFKKNNSGSLKLLTNSRMTSSSYLGLDKKYFVQGFWPTPEFLVSSLQQLNVTANADLVTIGGGGLIGDRYSRLSIPRYLIYAMLRMVVNRPFAFIGLGVLSVKSPVLKSLASFALRNASFVYCRDLDSLNRCSSFGVLKSRLCVAPDLSFVMDEFDTSADVVARERNGILINLREDPEIKFEKIEEMFLAVKADFPTDSVQFLVAEKSDLSYLEGVAERLSKNFGEKVQVLNPLGFEDMCSLIRYAKGVVCERLHVCALAIHLATPFVPLAYEDKVPALIRDAAVPVDVFSLDQVGGAVSKALVKFVHLSEENGHELNRMRNEINARTEEAKAALSKMVAVSLNTPLHVGVRDRLSAGVVLLVLFLLSLGWSLAALVKRIIFGRG